MQIAFHQLLLLPYWLWKVIRASRSDVLHISSWSVVGRGGQRMDVHRLPSLYPSWPPMLVPGLLHPRIRYSGWEIKYNTYLPAMVLSSTPACGKSLDILQYNAGPSFLHCSWWHHCATATRNALQKKIWETGCTDGGSLMEGNTENITPYLHLLDLTSI